MSMNQYQKSAGAESESAENMSVPLYKRNIPKIDFLRITDRLHEEVTKVVLYTMRTGAYYVYSQPLAEANIRLAVQADRMSKLIGKTEYQTAYAQERALYLHEIQLITILLTKLAATLDDKECVKLYCIEQEAKERASRHTKEAMEHIVNIKSIFRKGIKTVQG